MVVFKFSKYGDSMGTRLLGAQIRADLRPLLDGKEKVVLDFSGIDTVTNSFEMSLDELKAKTTFTGLTPMTERSILTALKRRQIQILQNQ